MTPKQQRFVEEYLIDLNATQAAIRAGYSTDTARQQGQRLLTNVDIARAVEKAMDERAERVQFSADEVLRELKRIAMYNPGRVFRADEDGIPTIDYSAATEEDWRVVAEVSNETTRRAVEDGDGWETTKKAKVKLHCKLSALDKAMRHLGLYNDKVHVDVSTLSDEERAARAAALLDAARARRDGRALGSQEQ